jgi:LacI family transcriptional regulator
MMPRSRRESTLRGPERGPSPARRATLMDVAAAAGVSPSTVSRALSNHPRIPAATRRRVLEVANSLDFAPNVQARALRTNSSMLVGVVVPDVAIPFYANALKGAQSVLESAGYQILVMNSDREAGHERAALATLHGRQVDGLLVATSGGFVEGAVPVVFFDHVLENVGLGYAAPDNGGGIMTLVEHLAGVHRHQRIAYLGAPLQPSANVPRLEQGPASERLEAFRLAMGRLRLPVIPEYVVSGDYQWSQASAETAVTELMGRDEPPTAIVAAGDTLALGALRAIRRCGKKVPDDVALVSFDDPVSGDLLDPPLTALGRHDRELGEIGARLLLDTLGGGKETPHPPAQPTAIRVPLELVIRSSCGCHAVSSQNEAEEMTP